MYICIAICMRHPRPFQCNSEEKENDSYMYMYRVKREIEGDLEQQPAAGTRGGIGSKDTHGADGEEMTPWEAANGPSPLYYTCTCTDIYAHAQTQPHKQTQTHTRHATD